MATVEECRQALVDLSSRLASDPEASAKVNLDRTVSCHIRDLDTHFRARLNNGAIVDIVDGEDPSAQIKLAMSSDDLLAMVAGDLHFAVAWASGRVSVKASFGDLLKLRKLL
ncbi:MAG TPA: alkyl sulfatase C-terminal domain-containing protein [Micromonosporaceae bacterium]|nr:alkyl sulfatase C-terminal domain-containing protein [Micromonosporaceae bacterium]